MDTTGPNPAPQKDDSQSLPVPPPRPAAAAPATRERARAVNIRTRRRLTFEDKIAINAREIDVGRAAKAKGEKYHVNVDDVWESIGYSRYDKAIDAIKKRFVSGVYHMTKDWCQLPLPPTGNWCQSY